MFNRDEQGEIISELIPIMKREFPKRELNQENVMEYFMSRVRQHLHIALCFSPVVFHLDLLLISFTNSFLFVIRWERNSVSGRSNFPA